MSTNKKPAATAAKPAPDPAPAPAPAPVQEAAPEPVAIDTDTDHPLVVEPPAPYSQELIDALPEELRQASDVPGVPQFHVEPIEQGPVMSIENVPSQIDGVTAGASDPEVEAEADALVLELESSIVPMFHPDGGTCDRYDSDEDGNILVPAGETALMFGHGFLVVGTKVKGA